MEFYPTSISEVVIIVPKLLGDERGFFMEVWREEFFVRAGINAHFVQENHSKSSLGVIRGLHYQISNPQGKLVRVVKGKVFDVAVDLRQNEPTCGQWVGHTISEENRNLLWIPPEFAHGFYVMSQEAEVIYKCTDYYNPEAERCIRWDDQDLGIEWPLSEGQSPVVSDKDLKGSLFCQAELF